MGEGINREKLTRQIIQLVGRVGHATGQYQPEAWLEMDLTIGQLNSLMFIDFEGNTNLRKLAAALGVTPPNATGIVDRLVEQELVSRKENQEDRRMVALTVTDKGKAVLEKLRERKTSHMSAILARLSADELSVLAQGLTALTRAFEAQHKGNQR